MFARLGLVFLIVVFGACTFVAGAMAPDAWRQPIAAFGQRMLGLQHDEHPEVITPNQTPRTTEDTGGTDKIASGGTAPAPAPLVPVGSAGPSAPGAAPEAKASAPVRLDSLLVTAAVAPLEPAAGQPVYALQLGQYATDQEAQTALRRFQAAGLGLPLVDLATLDTENEPWSVVAMGHFPSAEAARREAPRVQNVLDISDTPVIRLPAPPKPAS